jgi:transcriptional regulator with XRE-family HTH domain
MNDAGRRWLRDLGRWVRVMRTARGLTQEELAHAAGLDRSVVGAIERGEINWGVVYLPALAKALDTDVQHLMPPASNDAERVIRIVDSSGAPRHRPRRRAHRQ